MCGSGNSCLLEDLGRGVDEGHYNIALPFIGPEPRRNTE